MKRHFITIGSLLIPFLLAGVFLLIALTPIHRAFAAMNADTCASTHGTIMADCEKQFATVQNCADDAKSVKILPAYRQGVLVGEVDLRHSDTCNSYWTRTMAYGNSIGQIIDVEANNTFNDGMQDNENNANRGVDGSLLTFTAMTYKNVPQTASGVFDFSDGTSMTITL